MASYRDIDTTFYFVNTGDKDLVTIHRIYDEMRMDDINIRIDALLGAADAIREARLKPKQRRKEQLRLDFSIQSRKDK